MVSDEVLSKQLTEMGWKKDPLPLMIPGEIWRYTEDLELSTHAIGSGEVMWYLHLFIEDGLLKMGHRIFLGRPDHPVTAAMKVVSNWWQTKNEEEE